MPNKIQIKRTTVTGRTPNTTDPANTRYIDSGELSLNLTDGKLFSSNGSVYFEVGGNLQSLSVTSGLTANSTLVNAVALNVVNQTNTGTLFVTTSANVGTAAVINSTSITHTGFANITGAVNAASHTVGTTTVVNSTAISLGPFGVTNGALITTTSLDIGNTTANAALDYNVIYVANSTGRANLTPTTLAIGSITVNSALANLQALNVVNQTNTGTLFVTTSANVGTALTVNSTAINAAVNTSIRAIIANGSIGTSGQALLSNSTGIYWGTVSGGSISNYSANVGNGSATSITVTHNLNKENVIATIRENSSGYYVYPDIKYATTNTTVLEFVDAPTTDQYKVIVIGV